MPELRVAFETEFRKAYLEGGLDSPFERHEVTAEDVLKLPEVAKAYEELLEESFIFNKQGDFENSFEKKFEWGLVEVQTDVRNGKVVSAKVFSDSLLPELIQKVEKRLNEGDISYTKDGFRRLREVDVRELPAAAVRHLDELTEWVVSCIE